MKALLLIPLLLVTACSSMEWRKEGVPPQAAMSEWMTCRQDAERRFPPDFPMGNPVPIVGPSGTVDSPSVTPSHRESDVLSMAQGCMHDKGYRLVAIGK